MAKLDSLNIKSDDVFGRKRREQPKPATTLETKRGVGKPKIIPDSFRKVNFMLDDTTIKKLRMKALEEGESVNILLDRVIREYCK